MWYRPCDEYDAYCETIVKFCIELPAGLLIWEIESINKIGNFHCFDSPEPDRNDALLIYVNLPIGGETNCFFSYKNCFIE